VDDRSIILFDGVCNLCNGAVQFVISKDKNNYFRFASLQSEQGQQLLKQYQLPVLTNTSFVLIEDGHVYTSSTGALRVAKKLKGFWPVLYVLMIIPKFIRDFVYYRIAKNRYKWFGKKDECMIPTPELKARFLN
jgi:predicted DCC family thiol-disulfide oxidoreductase YuxK